MSDPMSSVEIEDVLSSIRRLVSEDLRPASRLAPQPELANKLILTPALRVVADGSGPEAASRTNTQRDGVAVAPSAPAEDKSDFSDQHPHPDAPASDLQSLLDDTASGENTAADADADVLPDPAETAADAPQPIEAVVAALGAAVSGQDWEVEAEAASPVADWDHMVWTDAARENVVLTGVETVEDAEVILPEAIFGSFLGIHDEPWAIGAVSTDADVTDGAALDADVATAENLTENARGDQAEAEAVAAIREAEVAAEASVDPVSEILADPTAASALKDDAPVGVFDDDDAVLDEEVLRDLVREIIREELQGSLGERITRNVRKLVRAEINRAMASREFD